jgi:arginine metabolism regulation protein II
MEIDNTSRDLDDQTNRGISIGPFGVLNLTKHIAAPDQETRKEFHEAAGLELENTKSVSDLTDVPFPGLSTAEEMLGNLDTYLQWADIFNLDPPPVGWTLTSPISGFEEHGTIVTPQSSTDLPLLEPQLDGLDTELTQNDLEGLDILGEGPLLLRHFNENVVTRIIWLPMTQKSPWHILNIPHAMVTLDQITYMGHATIKHASLANLYGILACAAFHLSANPNLIPDRPDQYWTRLSAAAYEEGKAHVNNSLELELEGPQKAKYKEQLMAMISLTTFTVSVPTNPSFVTSTDIPRKIISNHQRECRCHMVNMEYLIRLRGLVKPRVSRRARLLHYMYTWIRILTESTLVLHQEIAHTAPIKALWSRRLDMEELTRLNQRRAAVPKFEQNRGVDDFLRVCETESDNDLNIDDPKDDQAGLGDIHLVDSRNHPEELHTMVNGVSETWLGLLSQTTRLANVLDQINSGSCIVSPKRQIALQRRSLCLENMICVFTQRELPPSGGDPKAHMLRALNYALVIFFYRRVRTVNPCILQGYVKSIVSELRSWDTELEKQSLFGPGTAWPAFVAGCEAISSEDRHAILFWLRKANNQSGFSSYSSAAGIMEEVWKIRDSYCGTGNSPGSQPSPAAFSWTDYSKQNLQWLLLF